MQRFISNNTQHNTTSPTENWTSVYSIVRWIQLVMAILSMLGAGSIILYTFFQNLMRKPEVKPLVLLSVTDLLLALSWLTGAFLFSQGCESSATCYNLHTVEQMLYMASFFYTLNYVGALYTGLKEKYRRRINGFPAQSAASTSSFGIMTAIVSCVLPVLLTAPVFVTGNMKRCYTNHTKPYRCLLMHTDALYLSSGLEGEDVAAACKFTRIYSTAMFLATFFFTLLGIVVLMAKARSLYRRFVTCHGFLGDQQWATLRVLKGRMVLYPSAFFCCWGPATFLATMMLIKPDAVEGGVGVFLYIVQACTSASQGLLNCLVYGWTQKHFRSLGTTTRRDADTQTPLLRSQKRRDYSALCSVDRFQGV
ncbi:transmembrane protein 116 isoform X1 [Alosa pseudoharengus]|uniref:transmembrane protein 116 isoform X1 n=1 Tax=Alosa pseudoharengus TaxID=34774 RepID=UPI003F89F0FB